MLEFYYDFLDKYVDRRHSELIQMDTDSMYMALSEENLDDVIRPELMDYYQKHDKAKFLSTSKYHNRTPGLFKDEFKRTKMSALTSKCYYAENSMSWDRYLEALTGHIDKAENTGFIVDNNQIVTYKQNKLGQSAYYDK